MSSNAPYVANPRGIPGALVGLCGALVAIGVIAFVGGLMTDAATTWRAFHVNFLYFGFLSQAAVCLAAALVIVGARWAGPIRHVAEGLGAWVPISFVLFAVGNFFGREHIHTNWLHGAPPGKEGWLTFSRVYFTDLSLMAVMVLLTLAFLRTSARPTLKGAAETATQAKGMFQRGIDEDAGHAGCKAGIEQCK